MKIKKNLVFLTIILASICLFSFSNKVNAMTISDDGKYTLILNVLEGEIDGEYSKIIKFNVEDGETTVKLSELTKGIVPFNGENEFSHWGKDIFSDEAVNEELSIADFTWSGTSGDVNYTNGLVLWANFSDKVLKGTGTYYLTLDPFAGKINGQSNIRLTSKSTEYKTVDLTKYTPVRDGYTFVGWALNGEFVTSIDSSYFAERDAVTVTATYTKNSFDGDYNVLILNANGGKIDGKDSNKYNYVGGATSATNMSIFQYVPVRDGYTFNGWNTKKDGSGENYKYLYWAEWRNDEGYVSEFERDTLNEETGMYKNLTLYATWTKNADTPTTSDTETQPTQETVKEIKSTGKIKTNIEFADGIDKDYKLDVQEVEIKKELADKNVKFIADINVLDGDTVVKISDTKMKIRIAMPEDLKGYNKYEVVYILNDEIKETIPATVEDGYIVFETSYLNQYGIVATNVEEKAEETNNVEEKAEETNNVEEKAEETNNAEEKAEKTNNVKEKAKQTNNETNNPKTADNVDDIMISAMLFIVSITVMAMLTVVNRKKLRK